MGIGVNINKFAPNREIVHTFINKMFPYRFFLCDQIKSNFIVFTGLTGNGYLRYLNATTELHFLLVNERCDDLCVFLVASNPRTHCHCHRMMWAAGILASLGSITYPAISAFVSIHSNADNQGECDHNTTRRPIANPFAQHTLLSCVQASPRAW